MRIPALKILFVPIIGVGAFVIFLCVFSYVLFSDCVCRTVSVFDLYCVDFCT